MFDYYGRVSQVRSLELDADYGPVVKLGVEWADDFLPATCKEYEQLLNRETEDDLLVPSLRSETFALNATVLRVLAACFHGWRGRSGTGCQSIGSFLARTFLQQHPQEFPSGSSGTRNTRCYVPRCQAAGSAENNPLHPAQRETFLG